MDAYRCTAMDRGAGRRRGRCCRPAPGAGRPARRQEARRTPTSPRAASILEGATARAAGRRAAAGRGHRRAARRAQRVADGPRPGRRRRGRRQHRPPRGRAARRPSSTRPPGGTPERPAGRSRRPASGSAEFVAATYKGGDVVTLNVLLGARTPSDAACSGPATSTRSCRGSRRPSTSS